MKSPNQTFDFQDVGYQHPVPWDDMQSDKWGSFGLPSGAAATAVAAAPIGDDFTPDGIPKTVAAFITSVEAKSGIAEFKEASAGMWKHYDDTTVATIKEIRDLHSTYPASKPKACVCSIILELLEPAKQTRLVA